jgi:hypothetical protein
MLGGCFLHAFAPQQHLQEEEGRTGYLLNDKNRFEDMIHTPSPMLRTRRIGAGCL